MAISLLLSVEGLFAAIELVSRFHDGRYLGKHTSEYGMNVRAWIIERAGVVNHRMREFRHRRATEGELRIQIRILDEKLAEVGNTLLSGTTLEETIGAMRECILSVLATDRFTQRHHMYEACGLIGAELEELAPIFANERIPAPKPDRRSSGGHGRGDHAPGRGGRGGRYRP